MNAPALKRLRPTTITIGEALEILKDPTAMVLDARDAASYRAGRLDGAMLLHDGLMESIIRTKDKQQPLLIYCFRGNTSLDKARLFCAAGFTNVFSLAGGYIAWMKRDTATSQLNTESGK